MLAILDPVLFDPRQPLCPRALDELIRLLRREGARIPSAAWYWNVLQRELIRPLSRRHEYRAGLDQLRGFADDVHFPSPPPRVSVWSFEAMFAPLGPGWVDIMMRVVTGAVLSGEESVLLTHLREGRNLIIHPGPGRCTVREKACWDQRVRAGDRPQARVPLVCRRRNLRVPWTCRFDDRLPADADGAQFPFCPPPDWHKSSVPVVHTHQSRPTWRDRHGNHWARPATGGGHHWDVYLTPARAQEYGLEQLNITRFGAPSAQGAAGTLHHVPKDKQSRLKSTAGWRC